MGNNKFIRDVFNVIAVLIIAVLGCHYISAWFVLAFGIIGTFLMLQKKIGWAVVFYAMMPYLAIFNHAIISSTGALIHGTRFSMVVMTVAAIVVISTAHNVEKIPFIGLWLYLLYQCITSSVGWVPIIAYLKILNFALMLISVSFMSNLMQLHNQFLYQTRAAFMAFATLMIVGSAITYFIPSIGYSMSYGGENGALRYLDAVANKKAGIITESFLFNGITYQSQALGPLAAMLLVWLLCDVIFVERKVSKLHLVNIIIASLLIIATHSRTALVAIAGAIPFIIFYCLPTIKISEKIKIKIKSFFWFGMVIALVGMMVSEFYSNGVSKWLRKDEDVAGDSRSISEAITESRMGLIEEEMHYFKEKPVFGNGFQVDYWHEDALNSGVINYFTAPIEKGTLPVMVLEEGGVIGIIIMSIFFMHFATVCLQRKYFAVLALMISFFFANMGEATFFSPAGIGGFEWVLCCLGGLSIDIISQRQIRELMTQRQL